MQADFTHCKIARSGAQLPNVNQPRDALLKPRVMSLVVFTALVGLVIAPGHVHPVLAFTSEKNIELQKAAREAGATLIASDSVILEQLPHLLEQVLQIE